MKSILPGRTTAAVLALAILPAIALAADKETPSSVDMQKHTAAIGNALAAGDIFAGIGKKDNADRSYQDEKKHADIGFDFHAKFISLI